MATEPMGDYLREPAPGGRLFGRYVDWIAARPLWLAFAGMLLVLTLLSFAWLTAGPLIDELRQVETNRLPRTTMLQAARNADLRASLSLRNALMLKDSSLQEEQVSRHREAAKAAAAALERIDPLILRPGESEMWNNVLTAREDLQAARGMVLARLAHGVSQEDTVAILENAIRPYLDALTALQDHGDNRLRGMIDLLTLRSQSLRLWLTGLGFAAPATVLLIGWLWRRHLKQEVRAREARIASLQAQKQGLLREVHHRLKNHLQGLLGLLEVHRRDAAATGGAAALGAVHGHVLALIGVHGMQAASELEGIPLGALVRRQVALASAGFPAGNVEIEDTAEPAGTVLRGDTAVTVALVLTELIINAMKHSLGQTVRIALLRTPDGAPGVRLQNRVAARPLFDLNTGKGLGTGLTLTLTLMQEVGEMSQQSAEHAVEITLRLTALRAT